MAFRGSRQGQFNYHDQIPHGWVFGYADSSQGQFNYDARIPQPYRPTIRSPYVAPFRHPQPWVAYCEICDIVLHSHKCWETHNKGRKHRSKLRQKASNGQESSQTPNSQMNSVVQPKTVLESKKSKCHVENVSSQATISKYKNFQQKDNTSGNGHGFKCKLGGDTVGKYMKMDNGIKMPMESSKPEVSALSNSAEYLVQKPALTPPPGPASPIIAPICVGGSSVKLQFQHVSASQTQVSEGKEHHGIQNPTTDSDVSTMTEDMSSDSAALAISASPKGHMASQVHVSPPALGSSFEPENQHVLQTEVLKEQHEIQNHTVKITDQPQSISVAPFRHPQPWAACCEICEIVLHSHKCWETHNKGRKHRSKLRQKASNGQESSQIPNSQMNSVVQPKTVLESKKSKCHVENVSSQATIFKHTNFQQKDIGVSSKIPPEGSEGKPKDNTSGNVHGFKRKIGGDPVGKYMKMDNGVKRPIESSKPDVSALSNSAESLVQKPALTPPRGPALPIMGPTCVGGSSLKLQFQHVSASQTQVSEGKEHHKIQNPIAEKNDQPQSTSVVLHDQTASDVSTMTEDLSRGFKRKMGGDTVGKFMKINNGIKRPMESSKPDIGALSNSAKSLVQTPALKPPLGPALPVMTSTHIGGSSLKLPLQHVSASQTQVSEGKEHHEIQNPTAEKNDQPQPTSEELHDQTASDVSTMTEDMSSDSAALAIVASPKGPLASQVHALPPAPGSSFEPENQHVIQTDVLKGREQYGIQNNTVKIPDQPQSISVELHFPAVSNMNTQTENVNSDSSAIAIAGPMASQVFIPLQAMGSSFEPQIESQNSTDETNIQLLPSVLMEFDAPSGVSTNTKTADESSKAEAKADVVATELGITQLSQVMVCLKCGDEGFSDTLVFCDKCQVYSLHRYCLDGPVNFYDDVTWFCEDCEAHEDGESCHDQCILLPSRTSDSAKDACKANSDLTNYIERVKDNNHQQQNIAAKTKAVLSDCHSLSNQAQSQSINDCEEEEKFNEDCQSVPDIESNSSEGSVTVHDPRPIVDPIWRGSWCFSNQSSDTVTGLLAHLSSLACPKVLEETRLFPEVLSVNLLQRSAVWPKGFMKSGPNDESIALYFFPESERVERAFDNLVDDMISHDLAIKAMVKNAELLVFPSTVLPIQHRRFQAKYYLWGVFRAKQPMLTSL